MDGDVPGDLLVVSATGIYSVTIQENAGDGTQTAAREQFAAITAHEAALGQLTYQIEWIRVNGTFGGFDTPSWFASYALEGDTLRFAFSDAGYPSLDAADVYVRR